MYVRAIRDVDLNTVQPLCNLMEPSLRLPVGPTPHGSKIRDSAGRIPDRMKMGYSGDDPKQYFLVSSLVVRPYRTGVRDLAGPHTETSGWTIEGAGCGRKSGIPGDPNSGDVATDRGTLIAPALRRMLYNVKSGSAISSQTG